MIRLWLRRIFLILSWLFVAGVVFQVFLAGLGVFNINVGLSSLVGSRSPYAIHVQFGYLLGFLALILFLIALFSKFPKPIARLSGLLILLNALQSVLIWFGEKTPILSAFHPVNAIAIFLVGLSIAKRISPLLEENEIDPPGDVILAPDPAVETE